MPRKVVSSSSPKLREPYDRYLYADLRHELTVRGISCTRTGPQRVTGRAGFIRLLRDWDKAHAAQTSTRTQTQVRRTQKPRAAKTPQNQKLANVKPQPKKKPQPMSSSSTRVIRARRGCRFRLINALLSPDFNGRWGEMAAAGGRLGEVNQFWLDVHAAFSAQNSMLDALHFQDALFVNVTPNVILPHAAARLLQMWTEIVAMYRTAVAQAREAAAHNDNAHSFFDFCAGRLDLLYLHMAMLLEPQLSEFIMSDKIQNADPFSGGRAKGRAAAATVAAAVVTPEVVNSSKQAEADNKPESKPVSKPEVATKTSTLPAAKRAPGKAKVVSAPEKPKATPAPEKPTAISAPAVVASAVVAAPAAVPAPVTHDKPPRGLTQNPEMEEDPTLDEAKPPATVTPAKTMTATATATKPATKAKQAKPAVPPQKPAAQKKTQNAACKAKASSGASSAKETKQTSSTSNQKSPSKSNKAPSKSANRKSSIGSKPVTAQTSLTGKRQREEEDDTAIVEVPSVSDIVPHSGKRMHTTTAISAALTTRPSDMMLPPDEWDILENRLRKVNENIDRCHRGLAGGEANVSDSYKQSLEADLRFYSAIKQRLQEQLLVVMQSGY